MPFLGRPPVPELSTTPRRTPARDGRRLRRRPALPARLDGRRLGHARRDSPLEELLPDQARRREIERGDPGLRRQAGEGVILGRGAAVVLHDDPRVLHVLLDGPLEARVRQAMAIEDIDRATAAAPARRASTASAAPTSRTLYGVDLHEPGIFHLVLDSTAIALGDCVELIAAAAEARAAAPSRRR